ncbi:hypothetical protein MAM1_0304d09462 [Mucor ambiguus]|uniref:Uncharacterized protein n=1 Tax=Mucor ambiguus TaxID=91626 RepID=A0A0C9MR40_9FUNG|nr:hypothetical protein MAM1_0304d09462 [Mucor ambiguus]
MKPQMKVETALAAYDRAGHNSYGFSAHQNKSFDLSTQQPNQHRQQQKNTESACKWSCSNHTISPFTPPPSPSPKNKLRYSQKNCTENRSTIHILSDELIDMYEQTVQQCTTAENRYKRLDLTMKSTLKLQTKTYERCIEELNGRIEKLEGRSQQHLSTNSDFLNTFIDGYASEFVGDGDDNDLQFSRDDQIEALERQILLNEQSTQQTIAHVLGELEKERLKTKQKDLIIAKQDALISTLEAKMQKLVNEQNATGSSLRTSAPSKNEKLLEAQIELQAIELEGKKKLLAMLIHERDELSNRLEQLSWLPPEESKKTQSRDTYSIGYAKKRSSIDLLAKIVQSETPSAISAVGILQQSDSYDQRTSPLPLPFKKSHVFKDHSPPPPSPPPKSPLPSTPCKSVRPPPRSVSTRKSKPRRMNANQHQSGVKSWSCIDFEKALNGTKPSCYYIPSSSSVERPINQPTQESHSWRKHLVEKIEISPKDGSHHANGFSSLLKSWKRHVN